MSTAEFARKVFTMVAETPGRATRDFQDFEMAYQARVAADRIRFAIRMLENPEGCDGERHQIGIQLLDALDRLASADRRFQAEWRKSAASGAPHISEQIEGARGDRP